MVHWGIMGGVLDPETHGPPGRAGSEPEPSTPAGRGATRCFHTLPTRGDRSIDEGLEACERRNDEQGCAHGSSARMRSLLEEVVTCLNSAHAVASARRVMRFTGWTSRRDHLRRGRRVRLRRGDCERGSLKAGSSMNS